ncbi:MAG: hypothetical protein MZV70_39895 [Desulfobacterales bacterium]|nr:hypothetical protein [Desulfobacterales bacterium]
MMPMAGAPLAARRTRAMKISCIPGFATALCLAATAMAAEPPPRIKAVQQYLLEQDYPELFGDTPYRIKAEDVVEGDLDGDGVDEVVMLMRPHFRQSPTIVIFQVSKNLRVRRVKEGLAPGPLQPLSGDFLDSHTLGMGVDVTIANAPTDPGQRRELVAISIKEMGGVARVPQFPCTWTDAVGKWDVHRHDRAAGDRPRTRTARTSNFPGSTKLQWRRKTTVRATTCWR